MWDLVSFCVEALVEIVGSRYVIFKCIYLFNNILNEYVFGVIFYFGFGNIKTNN